MGANTGPVNPGHGSRYRYECRFHDPLDGSPPLGSVTITLIGSVPLLDGVPPEEVLGEYIGEHIIPVSSSALNGSVFGAPPIPSRDRYRERKFSGRVWWREAVRQLDEAGVFLECKSVDMLEAEIKNRAIKAQYLQRNEPLPRVFKTAICTPVL
jgi:hypothetical protein